MSRAVPFRPPSGRVIYLPIAWIVGANWMTRIRLTHPSRQVQGATEPPSYVERSVSSFWAILFPVWLVVGIRFGIFTPSEAGAFAVAYALFVGVVIYRELDFASILDALLMSVRDIGMIMFIILLSGAFGYVITFEQVPQTLAALAIGLFSSKIALLFTLSVFLLVFGMLVEATVIVMLLTPILVPVITAAGIDPVHFGIIMMTRVTFGGMTPPVGVSMFTVCGILNCSYKEYTTELVPFAAAVLGVVALIIIFPGIVMFLPDLLMGG
jgi:tripartite ATP-independent transporter DctM subunit